MIAGGISDILSSVIYLIQGTPIDLDGYLRSKAIGLAINVITAGIAFIGAAISPALTIANVNINAAGVLSNLLIEQLGYQVVLMGVAALVQNAGNQILNSNDGNIEQSIRNAIGDLLLEHKEELKVIFASDEVEGTRLLYKLLVSSYDISRDYAKRFNSDFAKVAKRVIPSAARTFGALGGVGMATGIAVTAVSAAVNVGMGLIKVDEATDDFAENFAQTIRNTASSISARSKYMMQNLLENSFPGQGSSMMLLFETNNFVTHLDIDHKNCNRIEQFSLQQYEANRQAISSACKKIAQLMSDEHMLAYQMNLHDSLSKVVFGHIKGMVKADIVAPLANFIGSLAGDYAMDALKNHHKISQQFKEMQEKVKGIQGETTTKTTTPQPPKKYGNPTDEGNPSVDVHKKPDLPKYEVTDSDSSLWQIAKKLKISFEELVKANSQIFNVDKIWPGDVINLPEGTVIPPNIPVLSSHTNQFSHETQPSPTTSKAANDNHKVGSTLGSCPGDGPGVCSSGYGIKETVNGNNYLRPTNSLSFTEFENHLIGELSIEKGDIGATDYIQEKYQEYLATGKAETSNFGLEMHKGGFLVDKFKADHPNANKAIKFVVDNTGKAVGLLVDGALYVLSPLKPVWEVYRDAVNALVPDVINEWVGNKEKQAGEGLKNWEKGLTSKQKLVLDTSIEGVEFGGNLAVIGGVAKLVSTARKLIIEDTLKAATTVDKPNIKTHVEFAVPEGVPDNWIIKIPDKGDGLKYVNPNNPHEYIRSMKGNPNNPNPSSQKAYIAWHSHGKRLDVNGNPVDKCTPEAHIDPNKFIYLKGNKK